MPIIDATFNEVKIEDALPHVWWNTFTGQDAVFMRFYPTDQTRVDPDTGETEDMFTMKAWSCSHPKGKVWPPLGRRTLEGLIGIFQRIET